MYDAVYAVSVYVNVINNYVLIVIALYSMLYVCVVCICCIVACSCYII